MRRLLAGLGATALLTGGGLALSTPAQAAGCSGTSGVTVVVQSASSTDVRCAPGDPSTAGAALTAAGFSVERVQTQPGAVCTINGLPAISCARMPPADNYWAFHHAAAGGAWQYSSSGIYLYDPAPGSAVGFRLGTNASPTVAPPAAPAPTSAAPRPTATARPTTSAAPRPSASASADGSPRTSAGTSAAAPQRAGSPSTNAPSSTVGTTPSASSSSAAEATTATDKQADAKKDRAREAKAKEARARTTKKASATPTVSSTTTSTGSTTSTAGATTAAGDESDSGSGALVPTAIGAGLLVVLGGAALAMARCRGH